MSASVDALRAWSPTQTYKDGQEIAVRCPFHQGNSLNLWANVVNRVFHCFKCGKSGTWSYLLQEIRRQKPSAVTVEALREELSRPRRQKGERLPEPVELPPSSEEIALPENFLPLHPRPKSMVTQRALAYLEGRGVGPDEIELYGIGFCPAGFYAGRIIVPVREAGRVVYWVARDVTGLAERKVRNPPASWGHKAKHHLFGADFAKAMGHAVVCEGVFDAMAVGPAGVALLGKTMGLSTGWLPTSPQFRTLLGMERVDVMLDADAKSDSMELLRHFLTRTRRPATFVRILDRGDPSSRRTDLARIPAISVRSGEELLAATLGVDNAVPRA